MASSGSIDVALTPDVAGMIREPVASGEHASPSDVVRDALRGWTDRRLLPDLEADEIRRLWREGVESGPGRFADLDALKREARRRSIVSDR